MMPQFIAGGLQFDRDGSGTITISAGNTATLENGLVPQALKNNGISSVARLGNTSLLHMPSAGIDANGNIFVTFSYPLEQDLDPNNVNLRDIMIVHSTDGGNTWADPQDITQIRGF
ncbi:MAG: sialidase family protein [Bacteroidia bacterium]